ncbi:zf-HC2 domain-containing protein [Pseudonocardia sp. KRD-184]|uniref:Zf-HC2 domain-containing protein n=1 Tax=Pseudonocardia oceani TaxID=2792013 RepID=A0ABS6UGX6_9PSEU|nr:zf-HC2 domain-containing protein [Pseudonocardia oceani]MBW0092988.1 zf-HC2 domain-containing protein [Pseudonocardia oceani]MBW0096197.1 zf-HC2 domain-containing protein [Pseudonocardia oceani]MBW0109840.1 zf-HC2 domain-containing protein [Pseudonocardia oceani]MBW0120089.1 zf-HC2 domain-containing protein [Pseudonocardia oceani]MBW0131509.1 zf-HC2 domain-containing protein [Pseudonocardia oceani]
MERGDAMACGDCRDAISARLDGEDLPGESEQVDAHVAGCAECRAFAERAARVTRLTRTRAVEQVPDLAAAVLAAAPPVRARRADAVRLALGGVGIGQFALAVSGVVAGAGHHGAIELAGASAAHFSHESSAWNVALAVGFLWAAAGGARAAGLVPVVGAFVGVLGALSLVDLLGGRVDPARLLTHGLVLAGFVLLVVLRRLSGDGGGGAGRDTAGSDRTGPAQPWTSRWTGPSPETGGGPAPTARRRAA